MILRNQREFYQMIDSAHWWVNTFECSMYINIYNKNFYKTSDRFDNKALLSYRIDMNVDIENIYDEITNQLNYL